MKESVSYEIMEKEGKGSVPSLDWLIKRKRKVMFTSKGDCFVFNQLILLVFVSYSVLLLHLAVQTHPGFPNE